MLFTLKSYLLYEFLTSVYYVNHMCLASYICTSADIFTLREDKCKCDNLSEPPMLMKRCVTTWLSWSCQACLVSRGIVIYTPFSTRGIWQRSVSFFISHWDKIASADHHWTMCYTCDICVICMLGACYSLETLYTRNSSHCLDSQTPFWH